MPEKNTIIILAPAWDLHAAVVAWGLKKNHVDHIWIPSLYPGISNVLSIYCRPNAGLSFHDNCVLAATRSIWVRRVKRPGLTDDGLPVDQKFIQNEQYLTQKNVFDLCEKDSNIFCVNDYNAGQRAESKLLQLTVAMEVGLKIPESLVSDDPLTVREFIRTHSAVITKSFTPYLWINNDEGAEYWAVTAKLPCDKLPNDESIKLCPAIYQELIIKKCDVRVTVIGEAFFALKITKTSGTASVDWRPDSFLRKIKMEPFSLSAELKHLLSKLMLRLGLYFGCVDLAIDENDEAVFLEVNQGGQFLFVEYEVPDWPVLQAFCAMLIGARRSFALEDSVPLKYADFYGSDDYQIWLRSINGIGESPLKWMSSYE